MDSKSIGVVNEIFKLFDRYGSQNYIGESITQIEHMIQTAMIAEEDTNNPKLIIASLLHDIGHLIEINEKEKQMNNLGVMNHEIIAKEWLLERGCDNVICKLIENHVNAKRYLVTKYPSYYYSLSTASQETFKLQGGNMTDDEMKMFEKDELYEEYLKIRGYDDSAKKKGFKTNSLEYYRNLLDTYLIN